MLINGKYILYLFIVLIFSMFLNYSKYANNEFHLIVLPLSEIVND